MATQQRDMMFLLCVQYRSAMCGTSGDLEEPG
jgi:hypothetical protein